VPHVDIGGELVHSTCRKYRGQMVEALGKMIARGAVRVDLSISKGFAFEVCI